MFYKTYLSSGRGSGGGIRMNMYYNGRDSSAYLAHYGRLGMKWYQHIYGDGGTGAASETNRQVSDKQTMAQRKKQVNSERREARNRIEFYGGKTAAKANISQERDYKINEIKKQISQGTGEAAAIGTAVALGSLVLGVAGAQSAYGTAQSVYSLVALSGIPAGGAVGLYLDSITRNMGNIAIEDITDRADRQTAYTDDMAVTPTKAKASDLDKDD